MGYSNFNPGIYIITNLINCKIYIGSSTSSQERLDRHRSMLLNNKHNNEHLQSAFNRYGSKNFTFEILQNCSEINLPRLEGFWQRLLNTNDREFGYNCAIVDEDEKRYKMTDETKRKISIANKGKKLSSEQIELLRKCNTGRKNPMKEETRDKISKANLGRKISNTTRENMRLSQLGKKRSEESVLKQSKTICKRVGKFSKNGMLLEVFFSAKEAESKTGFNLYNVLSGRGKTVKMFIWKYISIEEYENWWMRYYKFLNEENEINQEK